MLQLDELRIVQRKALRDDPILLGAVPVAGFEQVGAIDRWSSPDGHAGIRPDLAKQGIQGLQRSFQTVDRRSDIQA